VDGLLVLATALAVALARSDRAGWATRLLFATPWVAYQVVCVAVWGRTLGKAAVGTRVVREEDRGPVGWRAAIVRWAVPAVPTMALAAVSDPGGVVGLLWAIVVYSGILRDGQHRGLHDQAAGTIVVHEPLPA
jgi:uncharacterized RDD family membrane protein YckC